MKVKNNSLKYLSVIIMAFILSSCGEDQFAPKRVDDGRTSNPVTQSIELSCADFTLIKPKVDILFLWDNSTSTSFINSKTKQALTNTINSISSRFDYHVLLAPLNLPNGVSNDNHQARLIAENINGLSADAIGITVSPDQAGLYLDSFSSVGGSSEAGVQRAVDVIKHNFYEGNGIFRVNSYLYVVVMSNQDDNSWVDGFPPAASDQNDYVNDKVQELLCIRGKYQPGSGSCTGFNLNSAQLRFMNISAFSDDSGSATCGGIGAWDKGDTYQKVSKRVYQEFYRDGSTIEDRHIDQDTRSDGMYDSYNICSTSNFSKIFDGINSTIDQTLIEHKYDHWPVASSGAGNIDPNEISVYKGNIQYPRLSTPVPSGASGFTYDHSVVTQDLRYAPTSGEPFTGYVVKLHGNARVTYPECMRVKTQTPKEWFGYINLQTKPLESSIEVKINGVNIPNSSSNGWQLLKSSGAPSYFTNKNIKIRAPGDYTPETPALNKSGYFLKMNGNTVYSNGADIEVIYDPSA